MRKRLVFVGCGGMVVLMVLPVMASGEGEAERRRCV